MTIHFKSSSNAQQSWDQSSTSPDSPMPDQSESAISSCEQSPDRGARPRRYSGRPSSSGSSGFDPRDRRFSFDSIKESDEPQCFRVSTRNSTVEPALHESTDIEKEEPFLAMTTEALLPSSAFQGWHPDLLNPSTLDQPGLTTPTWEWQQDEVSLAANSVKKATPQRQVSAIEQLPFEILDQILSHLLLDVPPASYAPRNADLIACLLSCHTLHAATLSILYRNITIPHSRIFSKMLQRISDYPSLGTLVRRLDLSHYTVIGLGRSRKANAEIQNISPKTLVTFLNFTRNLKEFLVHEHVDDELNEDVLRALLGMPLLRAVDLCACSSQKFVRSFHSVITDPGLEASFPELRRLSLHECSTLQAQAFEQLLPRLPNLTHLDVFHTLITNKALKSIPGTARLTHLNLGKCTRLSGRVVVDFLLNHESTRQLQFLNVMSDISRYRLLELEDLETLLPGLPDTLRSLNINGSNIQPSLMPLLLPLTKHLEELGISHSNLSMHDINSIFLPPINEYVSASAPPVNDPTWVPSSLQYIDLTAISSITRTTLFAPSTLLLSLHSFPLSVVEISNEPLMAALRPRYSHTGNQLGWVVRELGRRAWLVRDIQAAEQSDELLEQPQNSFMDDDEEPDIDTTDNGKRPWKMGAKWWGMRKIPVAMADVGGMYGHYMFKA